MPTLIAPVHALRSFAYSAASIGQHADAAAMRVTIAGKPDDEMIEMHISAASAHLFPQTHIGPTGVILPDGVVVDHG